MPFLGDMVSAGAGVARYVIDNSVRLDGSADYFSRTPGIAGNRKTWTFSTWWGSCAPGVGGRISARLDDNNRTTFGIDSLDRLVFTVVIAGTAYALASSAVFRDPAAYYHFAFVVDTTQSTDTNRVKVYANGSLVALTGTYPPQNTDTNINAAVPHYIGRSDFSTPFQYINGYLAEPIMVDGTALTPSSFGETDASTGSWKPKRPSGLTYGTNGFWLDFSNTADLGNDVSGNNNDWTLNSLGSTDAVHDTPTNNFAVWDRLNTYDTSTALTNGNRTVNRAANDYANSVPLTFPVAGKVYVEVTRDVASDNGQTFGLVQVGSYVLRAGGPGSFTESVGWKRTGAVDKNGSTAITIASYTTGNRLAMAFDSATGKVWFGKVSGGAVTWENSGDPVAGTGQCVTIDASKSYYVAVGAWNGQQWTLSSESASNIPTGFKSLCTDNLPTTSGSTSGSFTGNASADGPFVWTGAPPATLTIDGNAVTFGTHADKTAGGFKIRTASSPYNDAATNNWTATYSTPQKPFVGSNKVPGTAQGNP